MFMMHPQFPAARISSTLKAAEDAVRAIPPAFPLTATVAVNPFLGQTGQDLATTAALLARVAGTRVTLPRGDYAAKLRGGEMTEGDLAAALDASTSPLKPRDVTALKALLAQERAPSAALPTVAELAARDDGTDWPGVIARAIGLWAAGHFDRGQALWSPAPGRSTYAAWRAWAVHDLTPEIAGLTGFCTHVAEAPDTAERAILRAAEALCLNEAAAGTAFHRLMIDLGGWAQHARWLLWEAELKGETDSTLTDLLAIRLVWEEAMLAHRPYLSGTWQQVVEAHAAPVAASADDVADAVLQEAAERAQQRKLALKLESGHAPKGRPSLQAAFCIDVRSEVVRRALEAVDPTVETIGFAGFFGLSVKHRPHGTELTEAHLPVLLNPALTSTGHESAKSEEDARIAARTVRAWGRFRQAAVSSFAFVEAAGPGYALKLVKDALALVRKRDTPEPAPRIEGGLTAEAKAATAAAVLKAMSMTTGHAPLVLLLGHGAHVTNNPHESAYHCGACGGHTGEVSARLLAQLLNDPETQSGLAQHGISLPQDTLFVAGLHDTTTDEVTLYEDGFSPQQCARLAAARQLLTRAAQMTRAERALRLPGSTAGTIAQRAVNWAEVRPEWGLAGCSAFIAAPRRVTSKADLGGRSFLHSYDWTADTDFATLELIVTAPVVVASWISLQYYGSAVAPEVFGGGNKLIHNVVGGIGVLQGNGGTLRAGLPWQAVHDGTRLVHEPLRLSVMIEAPQEAIGAVLAKHPQVASLFDNGWLHLIALEDGAVSARYRPGGTWEQLTDTRRAA
ncbi:MAG: DUF2309 domain-containing protein [Aestuariivirga sp.]|uniref:YbcC family protein n=1 Tax=Aestuariivirga sp. TaxID=2650926 RepID=UPI0025C3A6EE|nr:DUF2309 domain-containing protein [Aestuariivirga sp.]MCA3561919.1 DUF2309 domain-containing protein [Aestuariivirga sp.]